MKEKARGFRPALSTLHAALSLNFSARRNNCDLLSNAFAMYSSLLNCNRAVTIRHVVDIPPILVNWDRVFPFFPSQLQLGWCSIFPHVTLI